MKDMKQNEKGLTLIEVLASLVILSIILISFSSLLLQATKHTKFNKEKLTEVDIAEEVIGEIRGNDNCLSVKTIVEAEDYKDFYKVTLNCEGSTKDVPNSLGRAVVTVKTKGNTNAQKRSTFTTETYYKVGGGR